MPAIFPVADPVIPLAAHRQSETMSVVELKRLHGLPIQPGDDEDGVTVTRVVHPGRLIR
ncbi:MAG: hypothetical protein ACP5QO_09580 [Clostridia bacterium]